MFISLDRSVTSQHLSEGVEFGPAEPLTTRRGHTDGAVILDHYVFVSLLPGLGHITFAGSRLSQSLHLLFQAGRAVQGSRISRLRFRRLRFDQPVEHFLTQLRPN